MVPASSSSPYVEFYLYLGGLWETHLVVLEELCIAGDQTNSGFLGFVETTLSCVSLISPPFLLYVCDGSTLGTPWSKDQAWVGSEA